MTKYVKAKLKANATMPTTKAKTAQSEKNKQRKSQKPENDGGTKKN